MLARYNVYGTILEIFLDSTLLGAEESRKDFIWAENKSNNTRTKLKIDKDENGYFFNYRKNKVYIMDFMALPYELLVEKFNSGEKLRTDEVLATFLKTNINDILIEMEVAVFDTIIPSLGVGMTSDNYIKVVCNPCERRYARSQWNYKIGFWPLEKELRNICPIKNLYFSDFCQMVNRGSIKLLTREQYEKMIEEAYKKNNTLRNKLKNLFFKKKKHVISKINV